MIMLVKGKRPREDQRGHEGGWWEGGGCRRLGKMKGDVLN